MFVPGSAILNIKDLFDIERFFNKKSVWFSYARHALICYLRFLKEIQLKAVKTILLPDYMCHEVVGVLRDLGYVVIFYPLEEDFEVNSHKLDAQIANDKNKVDVLFVTHFYGKRVKNLLAIVVLCKKHNIILIEDCAHLPYNSNALKGELFSDAQLFSHRKLFSLPNGAQIILREDSESFQSFINSRISKTYNSYATLIKWIAHEIVKRIFFLVNIKISRKYQDLSQDPLNLVNFSRPFISALLTSKDIEACVKARRDNYQHYMSQLKKLSKWALPLEYDVAVDVPYQLLLTLRDDVDRMDFIRFFLKNGVSAVLGMAIDNDVLAQLPQNHPYRHHVGLPLHQDLEKKHIDYVCELMGQYQQIKGLK